MQKDHKKNIHQMFNFFSRLQDKKCNEKKKIPIKLVEKDPVKIFPEYFVWVGFRPPKPLVSVPAQEAFGLKLKPTASLGRHWLTFLIRFAKMSKSQKLEI